MNILKKCLLFTLCICLMSSMAVTSMATPPIENKEKLCEVTFKIMADKNYTGDISVKMKNVMTKKEYSFLLQQSTNYNATNKFYIPAQVDYEVIVNYPNADKFKLTKADGRQIDIYNAKETGLNIAWQIKEVINKPVNEAFSKFIEKTKFMENDSEYKDFLELYSSKRYSMDYLKESGHTEQTWATMSTYQQACYTLLYLVPGYTKRAKDRKEFLEELRIYKGYLLEGTKQEDVIWDALVDVWNWQWDNWKTNGVLVKPFDGTIEVKTSNDQTKQQKNQKAMEKETEKVFKQEVEKIFDNKDVKSSIKETANTNKFWDIFIKNLPTLIILAIVGIAGLVIFLKNKKINNS